MAKNKKDILIFVLIGIIMLMLVFIAYIFLVKPAISGLVVEGQNQGIQYTILSIMQQAATCQEVPLTFGNQTINIVAVDCIKQTK